MSENEPEPEVGPQERLRAVQEPTVSHFQMNAISFALTVATVKTSWKTSPNNKLVLIWKLTMVAFETFEKKICCQKCRVVWYPIIHARHPVARFMVARR